jgi:serine/threonine protein kinase
MPPAVQQAKVVRRSPDEASEAPCPELARHDLNFSVSDAGKRYEICDEIGHGAASRVHVAVDKDLNRNVAIKILRSELNRSRESVHRFLSEAQIMAKLNHPGIVPIYEVGVLDEKSLFYTMERVEGKTLRKILEERGEANSEYTLERLLRIYEQVCQIVGYAHSREVAHRDLKPENIMVGEFSKVYVMDWGIAKDFEEGLKSLPISELAPSDDLAKTMAQNFDVPAVDDVKGTPNYMSPEQVLGIANRVDYRSDVFSLGIILYEIVADQHPFKGNDMRDTLHAIKQLEPPPLRTPYGLKAFQGICPKALSKLPERRYGDAGALADDVRCALEHRPITAQRDSVPDHFIKIFRRHKFLSVAFFAFCIVSFCLIVVGVRDNRELERLLTNAESQLITAAGYERRIGTLEERMDSSPAALQTELAKLTGELRIRQAASTAAARAMYTSALHKRGRTLKPEVRHLLTNLWLDELDHEIRVGNRDGAKASFAELERHASRDTLTFNQAQRRQLSAIRNRLYPAGTR